MEFLSLQKAFKCRNTIVDKSIINVDRSVYQVSLQYGHQGNHKKVSVLVTSDSEQSIGMV